MDHTDQVVDPGSTCRMSKKAYLCAHMEELSHQASKMCVYALHLFFWLPVLGTYQYYVCVCVCTILYGNCQPPSMSELLASKDCDRFIFTPPVLYVALSHSTELPGKVGKASRRNDI